MSERRPPTDPHLAISEEARRYVAEHKPPSPELAEAIDQAQHGPDARDRPTLARCPSCLGCSLCHDERMVAVNVAEDWEAQQFAKGLPIPLESGELDETDGEEP